MVSIAVQTRLSVLHPVSRSNITILDSAFVTSKPFFSLRKTKSRNNAFIASGDYVQKSSFFFKTAGGFLSTYFSSDFTPSFILRRLRKPHNLVEDLTWSCPIKEDVIESSYIDQLAKDKLICN